MPVDKHEGVRLPEEAGTTPPQQRTVLGRLGRFAALTPPAVTLLLSAVSKPAATATSGAPGSSRQLKEPVSVPALQPAA